MQNQSVETFIQLLLDLLESSNRKILFLLTESDQNENILLEELHRLFKQYPDSKICVDQMSENISTVIQNDSQCKDRILQSKREIRQEVSLADDVVAVTMNLSAMKKISLGLDDSNVTFACMEALLRGKAIYAADDDYKSQMLHTGEAYRNIFEEAKSRTEQFGVTYCSLHQLHERLENRTKVFSGQAPERKTGKTQLVTIEALAKNPNLVIEENAIITPAARELLLGRNR